MSLLTNVNPSTVSRCGMVFIDSNFLDWRIQLKAWKVKTLEQLELTVNHGKTKSKKHTDIGFHSFINFSVQII